MGVTKYTKKSRPSTAASSIGMFDIGQMVKPDPESVAPVHQQASKSLRSAASGQTSKDTIRGQSALYDTPPSTVSDLLEELNRLQEAYKNDVDVTLYKHKRAVLRVVHALRMEGGVK